MLSVKRACLTAATLVAGVTSAVAQGNSTSGGARNDSSACSALAKSAPGALANLTVLLAEFVPAGLMINDTAQGGADTAIAGPYAAMCRVHGKVATSNMSSFLFEVFMPPSNVWNHDFMLVGNGGDSGNIPYQDMQIPLAKYGYAVTGTDTGHEGDAGDGTFALNNPQSQIDFGWRAVHMTAEYAKTIVEQFYGQAHKLSYYSGCSSGGKEGLKSLQMFPEDFDAAMTGSPAWYWSHLNGWTQYVNAIVNPPTSPGYINPGAWGNVHAEVLAQCDALDGVKDGIITRPGECFLDFSKFGCGGNSTIFNSTTCLNSTQLTTLQKIYTNWTDPATGEFLFPAFNIGSEFLFAASVNGVPFGPAPSYFLYQVLNVTKEVLPVDFPPLTINGAPVNETQLINLTYIADKTNPGQTTVGTNLTAYFARGGKLIMYVGGADWLIPTNSTQLFYNRMTNETSNAAGNVVLYQIPGMGHCSGGVAADSFGGPGQTPYDGQSLVFDPQHDMNLALRQWRVNGTNPGTLIGASYINANKSQGVAFTQKMCQWPLLPKYSGSGNTTDQASYTCA